MTDEKLMANGLKREQFKYEEKAVYTQPLDRYIHVYLNKKTKDNNINL